MILQELNVKVGLLLDEFQKNAAKLKDQANSIENTFKTLKGALISLGVFAFLKDSVAEFMEADRTSQMLSRRLQGLGGDYKAAKFRSDEFADAMSRASGIADGKLKVGLLGLLDITKNVDVSMSLLQDAMDLSVAKTMDLTAASELIGKAYQGDQRALAELGRMFGVARDKSNDFSTVMKAVRQNIEGTATDTNDLTQSIQSNVTLWEQFKENVGESLSGLVGFVSKGIRPTIEFLGKLKEAQDTAFGGLYRMAGNLKTLFTGGYKNWAEQNKQIVSETLADEKDIFQKHEEEKTKIARIESGKRQKWMIDQSKKNRDQLNKERLDLIKAEDMAMEIKVSLGRSTNEALISQMKSHMEEIKSLYGEISIQYQEYTQGIIDRFKIMGMTIEQMSQVITGSVSTGFEEMFLAITKEGANAEQAIASFFKAMGRSMLNSIAAAVEGMAAEGLAGYFKNMLIYGPVGSPAVSAFSLPLIASLSASAGIIRGMATMLKDGGIATKPMFAMLAESPGSPPEVATPLNRIDEVFSKYSHFIKGKGVDDGNNINIRIDNRGAYFSDSGFSERRISKQIADNLIKRNMVRSGGK
jgi:hypothetical protein